ncbi:MED6 mediator sub complex component-domain-containing protein [Gautieria morchelliformis]|nr:MED6 mediator sub complex component-domain-containing protein [Gautieria morchelliformis]
MFYDKQSNNQVLRMQTMHTGMPLENEAEELNRRFTGVEFALVHDEAPTLFIIHKRDRISPDEVRPLAAYFIMHDRIYQAPDVYNVVSNRLLATLSSLQASLGILLSHKPDFTPRMGYLWPIAQSKATAEDSEPSSRKSQGIDAEDPAAGEAAAVTKQRKVTTKKQENSTLLFNAMRTTAAQTQTQATSDISAAFSGVTVSNENQPTRASATLGPLSAGPSATGHPHTEDGAAKSPPGSGKKKRKRASVAPT